MSSEAEQNLADKDPTRLCPVCRMPISILAIRCRFCGAEVGRPRKEQETFTVKDLGGEQQSTYTLSGNVTEALEAFISEERSQIEARERERQKAASKTLFGRLKASDLNDNDAPPSPASQLPELDADRLELSSVSISSSRSKSAALRRGTLADTFGQKALIVAAVIASLIVLYFGAGFAWGHIRHLFGSQTAEEEFIYPNRAEAMYSSGVPLVDVLEEAITALRFNNTEENREIAEKMRGRLITHIQEQVNVKPFNMDALNNASQEISRAARIDSDPRIVQLMEDVSRETAYFKFILTRVDVDTGEAVFRLNNPFVSEREEVVSQGDLLQGRFLVKSINAREVRLEDTAPQGAGRQLTARRMESVAAS